VKSKRGREEAGSWIWQLHECDGEVIKVNAKLNIRNASPYSFYMFFI
jgi:hypothetical protein